MTPSYRWKGERPGFLLWKKFKSSVSKIPRDGVLELMSFDLFKREKIPNLKWKNDQLYYHRDIDQLLNKNGDYEKELLKKSFLNIYPHEVCQIIARTNFGVPLYSKYFHGGTSQSVSFEETVEAITLLRRRALLQGLEIDSFEINHTHPSLEIMYKGPIKCLYYMNGLSLSDLRLAENLKRWCGSKLKIRAITPNGFNYSYRTY